MAREALGPVHASQPSNVHPAWFAPLMHWQHHLRPPPMAPASPPAAVKAAAVDACKRALAVEVVLHIAPLIRTKPSPFVPVAHRAHERDVHLVAPRLRTLALLLTPPEVPLIEATARLAYDSIAVNLILRPLALIFITAHPVAYPSSIALSVGVREGHAVVVPCFQHDIFALVVAAIAPRVPPTAEEVAVHELAFVSLTMHHLEYATAMHTALAPLPNVLLSIIELHDSLALHLAELELALVPVVVHEYSQTSAMLPALIVRALIPASPVRVHVAPFALELAAEKVALVTVTVGVGNLG
mmetsp:Transcript_233/g.464  ORF Transcript_233/g.464 Transcript_233/m.464 type:complete len:299 (+) Transcript_233:505-1401(+)